MHRTSSSVLPGSPICGTLIDEPSLFDDGDLEAQKVGRPWSPVDPPLATLPESVLREPTETPEDVDLHASRADDAGVPVNSSPSPCKAFEDTRTDSADDAEPPPQTLAASHTGLASDTAAARIPSPLETDGEEGPVLAAPLGDSPFREEAPSPPRAADAAGMPHQEPSPSFAPSMPSRGLPSNGFSHLGKPGAAPKRIGSGQLVPARLTWKPRDPFAAGCRPSFERFRWELMLTSACVTAVCGLGCVWLLRTLLA